MHFYFTQMSHDQSRVNLLVAMNVDTSQIKVVHQGLFLILIEATLDF